MPYSAPMMRPPEPVYLDFAGPIEHYFNTQRENKKEDRNALLHAAQMKNYNLRNALVEKQTANEDSDRKKQLLDAVLQQIPVIDESNIKAFEQSARSAGAPANLFRMGGMTIDDMISIPDPAARQKTISTWLQKLQKTTLSAKEQIEMSRPGYGTTGNVAQFTQIYGRKPKNKEELAGFIKATSGKTEPMPFSSSSMGIFDKRTGTITSKAPVKEPAPVMPYSSSGMGIFDKRTGRVTTPVPAKPATNALATGKPSFKAMADAPTELRKKASFITNVIDNGYITDKRKKKEDIDQRDIDALSQTAKAYGYEMKTADRKEASIFGKDSTYLDVWFEPIATPGNRADGKLAEKKRSKQSWQDYDYQPRQGF